MLQQKPTKKEAVVPWSLDGKMCSEAKTTGSKGSSLCGIGHFSLGSSGFSNTKSESQWRGDAKQAFLSDVLPFKFAPCTKLHLMLATRAGLGPSSPRIHGAIFCFELLA